MYHMKRVLVTGAAGFIGSNFVEYLLTHFPDVVIVSLDILSYAGEIKNLAFAKRNSNHHFIKGDINDAELVNDLFARFDIDTVVHFAAESHVDNSISNPKLFLQTNILGTFTLLEAARKYWLENKALKPEQCRFHHVSTDEVYGTLELTEPGFSESHAYAPNSPYSASKAGSDHIVRAYHHTYGLPVTMSNCSNNYGPRQHNEKLIPTVINACLRQQAIPVYGTGQNIRDWLYVEDHCEAIVAIIERGRLGDVYNVGGNNELDNLSLIREICFIMDELMPDKQPHYSTVKFINDRAGHDFRYAIDNTKITTELAWQAKGRFEEKLRKTINSYCLEINEIESCVD